jgi:plasmid stability protein
MSKMIQIRNVPDDLHRALKSKAAQRGTTLSDYLLQMAERESKRLSWEEIDERLRAHRRASLGTEAADVIREARGPLSE